MTTSTLITPITRLDRCDRCSTAALVRVTLPRGGESSSAGTTPQARRPLVKISTCFHIHPLTPAPLPTQSSPARSGSRLSQPSLEPGCSFTAGTQVYSSMRTMRS